VAGLTNAERFVFQNLEGTELDLFGVLLGVSDETRAGLVEKFIVRRDGAIHQRVGAQKKFEARVLWAGPTCRQEYERAREVVFAQPEGRVTHPRLGTFGAVLESIFASESPETVVDSISATLKFAETGLRSSPKPAPTAKAQAAASSATKAQTLIASTVDPLAIAQLRPLGDALVSRTVGFQAAIQSAEASTGILSDVDASLSEIAATAHEILESPLAAQEVRRETAFSLSACLVARNLFLAGTPPLQVYTVVGTESLGTLTQRLYGGRAIEQRALILRLNRIRRPFSLDSGTKLLIPKPVPIG